MTKLIKYLLYLYSIYFIVVTISFIFKIYIPFSIYSILFIPAFIVLPTLIMGIGKNKVGILKSLGLGVHLTVSVIHLYSYYRVFSFESHTFFYEPLFLLLSTPIVYSMFSLNLSGKINAKLITKFKLTTVIQFALLTIILTYVYNQDFLPRQYLNLDISHYSIRASYSTSDSNSVTDILKQVTIEDQKFLNSLKGDLMEGKSKSIHFIDGFNMYVLDIKYGKPAKISISVFEPDTELGNFAVYNLRVYKNGVSYLVADVNRSGFKFFPLEISQETFEVIEQLMFK